RERTEDIPLLAKRFLISTAQELDVEPKVLSEEAEKHLMKMPWPGNVRELENTCRWLTVMCHSREVFTRDLPIELQQSQSGVPATNNLNTSDWQSALQQWLENTYQSGDLEAIKNVIQDAEQTLIQSALEYTQGKKHEAANLLGWGRNTLTRKIQAYKID
ncbi:MAG: nitrogen regulation protein NR(I), partial [Gammaproteobacteria bacterium]|nr:nitrogen regulation protein NR(I) [Gammaproteobacteria bacterium]